MSNPSSVPAVGLLVSVRGAPPARKTPAPTAFLASVPQLAYTGPPSRCLRNALVAACLSSALLLGAIITWCFPGAPEAPAAPERASDAAARDELLLPSPAVRATPEVEVAVIPSPLKPSAILPAEPFKAEALIPAAEADAVVLAAAPSIPEKEIEPALKEIIAPVKDVAVPRAAVVPARDVHPRLVDCTKLGTRIVFFKDPPDAFKKARDEQKLVFFIHLSGNFEDAGFT